VENTWSAIKTTAKQLGDFVKTATPLTLALVGGTLMYLIGARSNFRIR
jgi:hypothetical protein